MRWRGRERGREEREESVSGAGVGWYCGVVRGAWFWRCGCDDVVRGGATGWYVRLEGKPGVTGLVGVVGVGGAENGRDLLVRIRTRSMVSEELRI